MAATNPLKKHIQEALLKNDEKTLREVLDVQHCPSDIILWCLGEGINVSIDILKHLIEHGADVNAYEYDIRRKSKTALMYAAEKGDTDKLTFLIEHGADVNKRLNNFTALQYAIDNSKKECVQILRKHGAKYDIFDVENKYKHKRSDLKEELKTMLHVFRYSTSVGQDRHDTDHTPLMLAARVNDIQWAKELIDSGEEVNAVTKKGKTAMKFAVMHDSKECCKMLIDNGVDITNVDDYLRLALDHSSVGCTRLFLDHGANVNEEGKDVTSLILAIKTDDNEWAKDLLGRGADVNATVTDVTALMYAAKKGDTEKLAFLIEHGADINKRLHNFTALQYAIDYRKKECVQILWKHGAKYDIFHVEGKYKDNEKKRVKYLRESLWSVTLGARPTVRHDTDHTPLMLAARMNDVEWAKELIDSGEEVNAVTKEGKTAMKLAVMHDSKECCKVLIDNGVDITNVDDYLRLALDHSSVGCTRLFLDHGANLNEEGKDVTPLILAIKKNDSEWAKDLLERGADVNGAVTYIYVSMMPLMQENEQTMQKTPLMFAFEWQNLNFVHLLIDHGADVNIKTNEHGETVLDKIIQASKFSIHDVERRKRLREIYCVLVAHGARCAKASTEKDARAMTTDHVIHPPSLQCQARDSIYILTKGMAGVTFSAVLDSLIKDGYLPARLKPFMMREDDIQSISPALQDLKPHQHFPQNVVL